MPSNPRKKAIQAVKALSRERRPALSDPVTDLFYFGLLPAGIQESKVARPLREHRSIALILGAFLDQALEGAILAHLPGIQPENEDYIFGQDGGPLGELDSKIRMAFALGLIGEKARSDLSLLRTIRNAFGHSRSNISFDTPEIAAACNHLSLLERRPNRFFAKFYPLQVFIDAACTHGLCLMSLEKNGVMDEMAGVTLDVPPSPSPETPPES